MIKYIGVSLAVLVFACSGVFATESPLDISLIPGKQSRVEVRGWSDGELKRLKQADLAAEPARRVLEVYVAPDGVDAVLPDDAVPLFGGARLTGEALLFEPRFPFQPGVSYRAVVRRAALSADNAAPAGEALTRDFKIPEIKRTPSTEVTVVYPTADVLPENQLKFYLHFSAPMSRGDVYRHMHLLRADGSAVDLPFLEIGEELWDAPARRLTVFFDPGRIKRGLKPREEAGPVLEEGNTYTLVIDSAWQDGVGQPLVRGFRKTFKVAPPDDVQPDPKRWKLTLPKAGTREPLLILFNEPLDHAMLQRVLAVRPTGGEFLHGQVTVARGETEWRFVPETPWQAGGHEVVVSVSLEDRAGNSIRRPFEVDVFDKVDETITTPTAAVPFEIGAAGSR